MNGFQEEQQGTRSATVRHLRETAAQRVRATSLRRVAREIGMSPTGLRKFLNGSEPYSPTLHRLRTWYLQYAAESHPQVSAQDASAALAVLTHDLPPSSRRNAADGVLDTVARGYERSGRSRPAWVAELRQSYAFE